MAQGILHSYRGQTGNGALGLLGDWLLGFRGNDYRQVDSANNYRDTQTSLMRQQMEQAERDRQLQETQRQTARGLLHGRINEIPQAAIAQKPNYQPLRTQEGFNERYDPQGAQTPGLLSRVPQAQRPFIEGLTALDPVKAFEAAGASMTPRYENVGGSVVELGPQGAREVLRPQDPPSLPAGYRPGAGGGMEMDPGYLRGQQQLAEATRSPTAAGEQETWGQPVTEAGMDGKPIQVRYGNRGGRQIVEGANPRPNARVIGPKMIGDLMKVGTNLENLARLKDTSKPEFFGNTVLGGAANTIGRIMGDPSGQAQWWQDYQSYVNQVRNQLFGAALTPQEKAEFEKAIITPRMEAGEAAKNLQRQYEISARAAQRQASAYVASGYDKEAIEGALGFAVGDVDAIQTPTATPAPGIGGEQPQAQEQPRRITTQAEYDALPSGATYIDPDDGQPYRKP